MCANKCALGVALAGAGITRRRRSSWQRVAEAVAAAPARAVPVRAAAKAVVAEVEGRAQVTPAAGQARPVSRPAATGRMRRRQASKVLLLSCRACDARKFSGVYPAHASRMCSRSLVFGSGTRHPRYASGTRAARVKLPDILSPASPRSVTITLCSASISRAFRRLSTSASTGLKIRASVIRG